MGQEQILWAPPFFSPFLPCALRLFSKGETEAGSDGGIFLELMVQLWEIQANMLPSASFFRAIPSSW